MSALHPHWQATDDVSVPVRVAANIPVSAPAGALTVSRRPAAIVGILLTLSIGAVAYGTLDDSTAPLSGELMDVENPTTYFDVLAQQIARSSTQAAFAPQGEGPRAENSLDAVPSMREEDSPADLPAAPAAGKSSATLPVSIPTNPHTMGATVTENFHGGAPLPLEQPQTGAAMLWMTIVGALAGLLWKSRGMLKANV